ncbi:MAG: transposase [Planctomycetota bacterium]
MSPKPIYEADQLRAAYHLRFGWTGWPSTDAFPEEICRALLPKVATQWEKDGLRLLESSLSHSMIQLTFSVRPQMSPVVLAARVKGRLQYCLRESGHTFQFSRKLAVRSIGDNRTAEVQAYIMRQAQKEPLGDERFRHFLKEFTAVDPAINLSTATESRSGRYWYNLHLVLVVRHRCRIVDAARLAKIRDQSFRISRKKGHAVSSLSVMPDHLHIALRGNISHSPEEIALTFLNNLAFVLGQDAVWEFGYYAGTFGEYDMGAVRKFA